MLHDWHCQLVASSIPQSKWSKLNPTIRRFEEKHSTGKILGQATRAIAEPACERCAEWITEYKLATATLPKLCEGS
jgi:hypothetical protein